MSSIKGILRRRSIKFITSFYDPLIDLTIGNQQIKIPLSHPLKYVMRAYPEINYNLPRLIKYVASREKDVKVIDIGANVGDTVAFIKNFADVPILCIDGDEHYLNILKKNITKYNNVSVFHSLVGAETKQENFELKKERGTAYIVNSSEAKTVNSLERILELNPEFLDSRFLKIDTDGFDTIILKGSPNYLTQNKPILFFEFDPYLAKQNNDDPFTIIPFLKKCGYEYLMFYHATGDFVCSCSVHDEQLVDQMVHYFSGRKVEFYADVCAFPAKDKDIFENFVQQEIAHFRKVRGY